MNILETISKNMRREARSFVRRGTDLPKRSADHERLREAMILEEQKLYDAERAAGIRDRLTADFGEEWMVWAKSLYVDEGDRIVSTARDWNKEKSWPYSNDYEKWSKINELIRYKMYDRSRGRGDVEEDLSKAVSAHG